MAESWNKREREQKKRNTKKQKAERKIERKESSAKGKSLNDMLAYVDENGNLSATPPEKKPKQPFTIPPVVANSNSLNSDKSIRTGIITFFDASKGYGFIKDSRTQQSVFVHINSSTVELKENLKVDFEIENGVRGQAAVNVKNSEG